MTKRKDEMNGNRMLDFTPLGRKRCGGFIQIDYSYLINIISTNRYNTKEWRDNLCTLP